MSDTTALEKLITWNALPGQDDKYVAPQARAELTDLCARCERAEAELQAANVYLDESLVNSEDDPPMELAERIAGVVNQLYECRTNNEALRIQLAIYQRREALRQ